MRRERRREQSIHVRIELPAVFLSVYKIRFAAMQQQKLCFVSEGKRHSIAQRLIRFGR
jgi:hypothetical protein